MQAVDFYGLRKAITDAFTEDSLNIVLDDELNKKLGNLVASGSFDEVVYRLLNLARREGWLENLLKALIKRSNNRRLQEEAKEALSAIEAPGETIEIPDRGPGVPMALTFSPVAVGAISVVLIIIAGLIGYFARADHDPGNVEIATAGFGPLDTLKVSYPSLKDKDDTTVVEQHGRFPIPLADLDRKGPIRVDRATNAKLTIKTLDVRHEPLESINVMYRSAATNGVVSAEGTHGIFQIPLSDIAQDSTIELKSDPTTEQVQRIDQTFELKRVNYRELTLLLYMQPVDNAGLNQ
jgi:Effector-associated domain 1